MNLEVCFETWKYQNKSGYVFVSSKEYDGTVDKKGKPNGLWSDTRFKFPSEKKKIEEWANKYVRGGKRVDLYWCPNIFDSSTRKTAGVKTCRVLYADLDFVNPEEIKYRPSVAWQSSPDRYQSLWFLEESIDAKEFEELNKSMTYLTGADKSGWDLTQVLRIPGLDNHKTEIATKGKLLWAKYTRVYESSSFDFEAAPAMAMDLKLTGNFFELITKHKAKLEKAKIAHRLQWTSDRVKGADRSDNLWAMTREMLKVNIPLDDIASLIQQSAWNKYADRSPAEEKKRIVNDINKAHKSLIDNVKPSKKQEEAIEEVTATEEDEIIKEAKRMMGSFRTYEQIMSSNQLRPNWLIDKIWVDKAQGIVCGEAKTYKSTLTTDIAMSVASGAPLWGQYKVNNPGPVIIVQVENNEDLVKDRMARMGESKGVNGEVDIDDRTIKTTFGKNLPIYTHIADKNHPSIKFSNDAHRLCVEMMIKEIKPRLVIFDPLYQLFEGDMSSSQELAPALRWLKDLRINYGTAVILVHHYNKGSGDKNNKAHAGHRMLGSVTLHGWVECMLALEKGPTSNNITQLVMNKEFRAMGSSEPIHLAVKMGDGRDDYTYEVTCKNKSDLDNVEDDELLFLDLVASYGPKGVSKEDLCESMKISSQQLTRLMTKAKCTRVVGKGIKARVIMEGL